MHVMHKHILTIGDVQNDGKKFTKRRMKKKKSFVGGNIAAWKM